MDYKNAMRELNDIAREELGAPIVRAPRRPVGINLRRIKRLAARDGISMSMAYRRLKVTATDKGDTMTAKGYKISNKGNSMVITHADTSEHIAEYRMMAGHEASEIRQMRRAIDRHLADPTGTLGNYQW